MKGKKFKIYLPLLFFFVCAFSCKENNKTLLLFDMEKVEGNYFTSRNLERVSNSLAQSSDYSKSGNYSAKIDSINPYALSYNFNNLKKGNKIIISVWEKTGAARGYLKLVDEEKNILAVKRSRLKKIESQWVLINLSFTVEEDSKEVKFFIHNEKTLPAYYDDLKIELLNKSTRPVFKKENIGIQIKSKDLDKLFKYRDKAIQNGVIGKSLKKYFRGLMVYNKEEDSNQNPFKRRLGRSS